MQTFFCKKFDRAFYLSVWLRVSLGVVCEVHVSEEKHGSEYAQHVQEGNAEYAKAALPRVEPCAVLGFGPARVRRRQVAATLHIRMYVVTSQLLVQIK